MPNDTGLVPMPQSYMTLKARHRHDRDAWPTELSLRIHHSLSWLHCAEECKDEDSHFIYLWISFNAAYANDADDIRRGEGHRYKQFLRRLVTLDISGRLERLLWDHFSGPIRILLKNKYVFQPFWDQVRKTGGELDWDAQFKRANAAAASALAQRRTPRVLAIIFSRLYTLRNQLVHGGATWSGGTNRHQLQDGIRIMSALVPLVIEIMMDNPGEDWGEVCYPVVA